MSFILPEDDSATATDDKRSELTVTAGDCEGEASKDQEDLEHRDWGSSSAVSTIGASTIGRDRENSETNTSQSTRRDSEPGPESGVSDIGADDNGSGAVEDTARDVEDLDLLGGEGEGMGGELSTTDGKKLFNWETLTRLACRLEAATSRLEDIVTFESQSLGQAPAAIAAAVASNAAETSAGASKATGTAAGAPPPPPPPPEPLPSSIVNYDEDVLTLLDKFEELSRDIDPLLAEQAKFVRQGFQAQRLFLLVSTKARKPDIASKEYLDLIKDMQSYMNSVNEHREAHRAGTLQSHLSMVSEAVPALAWVTLDTKPAEFVTEMANAGQFYGNRVIKEYKEKDKKHVEWVRSWYNICKTLEDYVRKYHVRGISWNRDGGDAPEIMATLKKSTAAAPAPAPTGGAPPPPPPPPPPGPAPILELPKDSGSSSSGGGDMGAVFAQLNQGTGVTAGLRKVDKSEMTHKNPSLRASSLVSGEAARPKSPGPQAKPKPAHMKQKKPPKMELDGNKWIVENYENEQSLSLPTVEINQTVSLYHCKNTTLQIKGKFNAIFMNECEKTNVVIDSLVSSIDVIKSKKFAFQIMGVVPAITVDECDSGTLYVSKESTEIEIYTSKTTAFNVYVPGETEEDDFVECPIPEQIKSTIKGKGLVSEIVEHAG
ncbi:hypothetical protein TWF751_000082 [Orbilia oligospora]|nr:hypothetical protein TWF751_000082 [Orbilia oligospora]